VSRATDVSRAKFLTSQRTESQTVLANRISLPMLRDSDSGVLNAFSSEYASTNGHLGCAEPPELAISATETRNTSITAFFTRLMMFLACVTFSVNALADPQMVNPSPYSTISGIAQKFSWDSGGADVERYWLYVGTAPGLGDIANSDELGKNTEFDVIGMPADGSTVYVRLWYSISSQWFYADSNYTSVYRDIVTPSAGSTLSGSEQTFSWNIDDVNVERVWLYVGTTGGGREIADSGDLGKNTEFDVIGIPVDGSKIYVRFWYYSGSRWFYVDSSYTTADLDVHTASQC